MIKRISPFLPILFLVLFVSCNPVSKLISSDDVLHWEQDMQVFDSLNTAEDSDEKTLLVTSLRITVRRARTSTLVIHTIGLGLPVVSQIPTCFDPI